MALIAVALSARTANAEPPAAAQPAPLASDSARRTRAETIDLDLQRADLRDVLRLLAEVGAVSLVYGDDVAGEVTLRLHGVPWEQALHAVLAVKGLEMEYRDGIVFVGTAQFFAALRKAQLDARARCLADAPLRRQIIRVNYATAQDLVPHVRARLSERGSVSYDARTNALIVYDVDCD